MLVSRCNRVHFHEVFLVAAQHGVQRTARFSPLDRLFLWLQVCSVSGASLVPPAVAQSLVSRQIQIDMELLMEKTYNAT